ncbi:MAG: membrane protein insertase YidC [Spirochaetota bacterium]
MKNYDHAKKMQTIGLVLLVVMFSAWVYYQSRQISEQVSNAPPAPPEITESRPRVASAKLQPASPSIASVEGEASAAANQSTGQDLTPLIVETDVYRAELSPVGAVMRSLLLKEHHNDGEALEMVRSVDSRLYPFTVYLGDYNDGQAILLPFQHRKTGERSYYFRAEFTLNGEEDPYVLEKTFEFARSEYMVKVGLRLQRKSGSPLALNQRRVIYSLYYGPQIGPTVDHIGSNRTAADMRSYVYYNGKKSKTVSLSRSGRDKLLDSSPIWAGISGKYFAVFGLPRRNLDVYWTESDVSGLGLDATGSPLESSQFLFERSAAQRNNPSGTTDLADDTFYYYIGPLLADDLNKFNVSGDNEFGLYDAGLNSVVKFSLGFIEEPVKWILNRLYSFTYNYGIAIMLFALIVRILLYPLTLKAYKSSRRMRVLQPQMKALQEKYRSDPRRLQQEMASLYRTEKVNPMGGCLPLLVQMPILIAIANLFYRYFELRGASFIPGWINDLSTPDLVYTLDLGTWTVPLRLLPLIYLGSQLVSSKIMQAGQPPMQSKMQQRMFTVYMPIIFSVLLYNMPSGLILYWTISNLLMMVQQFLQGKFLPNDEPERKHETDLVLAQDNRNYTRHKNTRENSSKANKGEKSPPKSAKKNKGQK